MRWYKPPYLFVFIIAPIVGVGVSRIALSLNEQTSSDQQCVPVRAPFSPLKATSILRLPKQPKPYRALWRPSKRRGLRRIVTTLYSVHLHEAVPVLDGQLPPPGVLDRFYRCRGFGTVHPVDPRLTEAVIGAATHFKASRVEVISAFRSPKFNDSLAKKGRHVASESKHTKGMAMDIRIVNTPASDVGKWMYSHFEGGVGTYVGDDFVHIDTGPKRRWRGR